jgi:hypothetical protein
VIQNTDVEGRLRLFRYGLIVIVVVTFLVSLLAPYVVTSAYATELNKVATAANVDPVSITIATFLGQALITTAIVAVLMAAAYFVYRSYLLKNTHPAHA